MQTLEVWGDTKHTQQVKKTTYGFIMACIELDTARTKAWTSLQNWSENAATERTPNVGVTVTPLQLIPYNGSDVHSYNGVMFTLDRSLHSGENHFFLYN